MKLFITGGTGFVGSHIVRAALEAGHAVKVLVRPDSPRGGSRLPPDAEPVQGDVLDPDLAARLQGVQAVIHLVGIIRAFPRKGITFHRLHVEATANVIKAMKIAGVSRLVHMSALGAQENGPTEYFRTKALAEKEVKESGLRFTIFRPSVIYGPGDEFITMLARQIKLLPLVPVIGDGRYQLQPVHVQEVAESFIKALELPKTEGRTYEVAGPEPLTYNELLDRIAAALGKNPPRKVHLPVSLIKPAVRALEWIPFFPVTMDQLTMLFMGNTCDPEAWALEFGIKPRRLDENALSYL